MLWGRRQQQASSPSLVDRITSKPSSSMLPRDGSQQHFAIQAFAPHAATMSPAASAAGRPGVPKVPSMLFDLDMEVEPVTRSMTEEAAMKQRVQQVSGLAAPSGTSVQVAADVATALQLKDLSEAGDITAEQLAKALVALGYPPQSISIRQSLGGGEGGECLRNLRHTFLFLSLDVAASCVLGTNSSSSAVSSLSSGRMGGIIIDPTFQEQFRIPVASPRYSACLEVLPRIYVGDCSQIKPLVEAVCAEMQAAFAEQGVQLPPWRRGSSMLSKWLPRKSCDLRLAFAEGRERPQLAPVAEAAPAPAAAAAAMGLVERTGSGTTATSSTSNVTSVDLGSVAAVCGGAAPAAGDHLQQQQQQEAALAVPVPAAAPAALGPIPPTSGRGTTGRSHMAGVVGGITRAMANAGRITAWLPSASSGSSGAAAAGGSPASNGSPSPGTVSFEPLRRFVGGHFPPVPHQATQLM